MVNLPAKLQGFLADCFLLGTAESVESHYQEIRTSYGINFDLYQKQLCITTKVNVNPIIEHHSTS